jgi:hypothetical protein
VSTILDALRKLQGDREGLATPPRRDLRSSVLDSGPLPPVRAPRPEPKMRPLAAALAGGAVVAAGLGAFVLWDGGAADSYEGDTSALEMPSDETALAQIEVQPMPPSEPAPPPRAPEPLVNLAAPPEPPPESREARYAAFQPPQPPSEPASDQPLFQTPETFAPVNQRARPRVEDDGHGETQATYPPQQQGTYGQQAYEPPQIVTREAAQKPTRPAELESAMDRARQRLARADSAASRPRERREEPPPAREPERPAAEERTEPASIAVGVQFPDVQVQSVLWHPDPLRRQATVLLDGQLTTDAREGDLIAGVLVDRITPGSVEFRMGQERKRVDMAP